MKVRWHENQSSIWERCYRHQLSFLCPLYSLKRLLWFWRVFTYQRKNVKILSKKYQLRYVIPSKSSGGHISRTIVTLKRNVLRKILRTNGHLHKKRLKQFTLLLFKRIQDIFWREVDDKYQRYICICLLSRNLIYEKIFKMHLKRPCYAIKYKTDFK